MEPNVALPHPSIISGANEGDENEVTGTSVSAVTHLLDRAICPTDVRTFDDADLVETARQVERLARKVEALQLAVATEVAERSTSVDPEQNIAWRHGCRGATELLQQLTQSRRSTAARRVRHGALLSPRQGFSGELLIAEYPVVAQALANGTLSVEAAHIIIDSLERLRHKVSATDRPVSERYLVAGATGGLTDEGTLPDDDGLPVGQQGDQHIDRHGEQAEEPAPVRSLPEHADEVRVRCHALTLYFDQDGTEPTAERAALRRGFRFGKVRDGLVPVTGALLPETAALLGRLFDAINSPRTSPVPEPPVRKATRDESFTHYNDSEYVPFDENKPGRKVRFVPAPDSGSEARATGTGSGTQAAGTTREATGKTPSGEDATATATEVDFLTLHGTDARSADHRRHDALAALLAAAAKHADTPTMGGAPVTVLIQATEEALEPGRRSGDTHGVAWLHDHEGSHTPVPLSTVRHSACAGGLQRITQAANGRIVEISTEQRIFNAHQRRAIMLRDGGCIIPGCTTPATWCEIHHVTEWSRGGPTHTDNGVLLCFHHHRTLETSGWSVRMQNGTPQVRPPGRLHGNTLWWSVRPATRPPVLTAAS